MKKKAAKKLYPLIQNLFFGKPKLGSQIMKKWKNIPSIITVEAPPLKALRRKIGNKAYRKMVDSHL